ncbi:ferritin-like domain-containing protein [Nannocystis punicea]|uniref:Ferritin-like domain-containing protein n=1 Tax=Nannocystis punicea TaxID=2995304 RepID=A0ABY7H2N2_9BACT|nr:ferritin-like domain-containing protein [Nannocystis poenicansa]WAS93503.1 ferritin-like domain-containing protein [Nannocystis poenicansa]
MVAFAALADELARLGAPAELLDALAEAARDEQRHAARVTTLARRRGADIVTPTIADTPARDLLALAIENAVEGCVYETWAALVTAHQARAAQDPALRAAFAEIAADEARHADLAWAIDAWLLEQLDEAARAEVAAARRAAVRALATGLAEAPDHAELVALGLPSSRVALQLCSGLDAALWSQAA